MNFKVLAALGLSALVAGPALAGVNPQSPGLPNVTDAAYAATMASNAWSSMCVDCHTVAPKPATTGGSHYVSTSAGATNSGGSGMGSGGTIVTSDDGKYFRLKNWDADTGSGAAWPSKYGSGTTSGGLAYRSVVNQNPPRGAMNASVAAVTGSMDLICESCHSIVGNPDGGNNLLAVQPSNNFEDGPIAVVCVGCHGFMYSNDASAVTASGSDTYAADDRNNNEVTAGRKGNNEYHWVRGTAYPQNHHVMTGDQVSGGKAAVGALWTDNLIIAYADHATDNTYTGGTLPQKATWAPISGGQGFGSKPTAATDLSCTNCHTPAHGFNASPGASILRNASYTGVASGGADIAGTQIDRIGDRGGWKKINDLAYCTQCHIN